MTDAKKQVRAVDRALANERSLKVLRSIIQTHRRSDGAMILIKKDKDTIKAAKRLERAGLLEFHGERRVKLLECAHHMYVDWTERAAKRSEQEQQKDQKQPDEELTWESVT